MIRVGGAARYTHVCICGGAQFSLTFSFCKANFDVNFRLGGLLSTQKLHENCGYMTETKGSCMRWRAARSAQRNEKDARKMNGVCL